MSFLQSRTYFRIYRMDIISQGFDSLKVTRTNIKNCMQDIIQIKDNVQKYI